MKGPMYVDKNPFKQKVLRTNHSRHLQTLKEIQESKSRMIDCTIPETYKFKKTKKYLESFKAQEIYRENQNLLGRLLSLTQKGKKYSRGLTESPGPKSLNSHVRRLLQDRIQFENKGISFRINSITPSVDSKEIKKHFNNHVKMLGVLAKVESFEKEPRRKRLDSLGPIGKKESFCKIPSGIFRNPYLEEDEASKKEWRIAELNHSVSGHYLMAIPIAVSP